MSAPTPLALIVSDVHLSHRAPVARKLEKDWYGCMARQWEQVRNWKEHYCVPLLCSGDLFDVWNPPPELIGFAMDVLPMMYAIPGQHDLPYHNYDLLHKSAYGVLAKAGKIFNLEPQQKKTIPGLHAKLEVYGFPWGFSLRPCTKTKGVIQIALVHEYCWMRGHSFPNVPQEKHAKAHAKRGRTYDALFFGDNHSGFDYNRGSGVSVYNVGCFYRRRLDEKDYNPRALLLHDDGTVTQLKLDVSQDRIIDGNEAKKILSQASDYAELITALRNSSGHKLDFETLLKQILLEQDCDDHIVALVERIIQDNKS